MYKTKQQFLLVLMFMVFSLGTLIAQTVISGTVLDEKTKEPLPGSTIVVKETIMGTATDANGKFTITLTKGLPVTLKISNVGYESFEINVTAAGEQSISLKESPTLMGDLIVTGNRVDEKITKAAVTVEKLTGRQLQLSPSFDQYSALQNLKGVDLLSQSLTFKSVNLRGFGANNNNRFVQLVDGMDNRSPGLGFGFGSAAGVSDIDIESIEILPGASSALYGPDALQGLMLTKTKSPFDYQGLSAQVKVGVNNVGKTAISATPYTDAAIRYAHVFNDKFAFKVNLQAINGTDFIADNYNDRSHRNRPGFFVTNIADSTIRVGGTGPNDFRPNNDPNSNLQYDGVNVYGDDFTNGGSVSYTLTDLTAPEGLRGKTVTRSGYNEYDLTGDKGKIFSYRANAALHYRVTDKIEAIGAIYYGNGNLTQTGATRNYIPNFNRTQFKLELKGDNFFVRGYNSSQHAEGFSMGNLAARLLQSWKSTTAWGNEFKAAYALSPNIATARAAADAGKPVAGSAQFNTLFDKLSGALNTDSILATPGSNARINGTRFLDNSSMAHFEGMYNLNAFLPKEFEVVTGASYRKYNMLTKGTLFPTKKDGSEFTMSEIGAYIQGSYTIKVSDLINIKPTVAVRYDKNEFFNGGLTPRVSGVVSIGEHNFRASWQSAFRNPSPNQLLSDGKTGEVGGARVAVDSAGLIKNPGYTSASVATYRVTGDATKLVPFVVDPTKFTTEKIKTWEIGYKTLIGNKLYVDAFYFNSTYNDFIAAQSVEQPINGVVTDLKSAATTRTYANVNFNNFNEIYVNGFGFGVDYALGGGYSVAANYANQVGRITLKDNFNNTRIDAFKKEIVKRKMSDPAVSQVQRNFFISPENRFNLTFSNPKVTDKIGFSLAYRWTDKMWVEQGNTQGDVMLPSWSTFDASVTYRVPTIKSAVKLGASNLLNKYYSQGYGLAQIGGLYYVSFMYGIN
jgi:iron complex outermembrane recepter protein